MIEQHNRLTAQPFVSVDSLAALSALLGLTLKHERHYRMRCFLATRLRNRDTSGASASHFKWDSFVARLDPPGQFAGVPSPYAAITPDLG